jgi:SAM-dependent methyltransferase
MTSPGTRPTGAGSSSDRAPLRRGGLHPGHRRRGGGAAGAARPAIRQPGARRRLRHGTARGAAGARRPPRHRCRPVPGDARAGGRPRPGRRGGARAARGGRSRAARATSASFDAAICLCEGAFCLVAEGVEPLAHDRAILAGIHRALRPGGRLVLTGLSAARMLTAWQRGEPVGDAGPADAHDDDGPTRWTTARRSRCGSTTTCPTACAPWRRPSASRSRPSGPAAPGTGGANLPGVDDYELLLVARRPA